MRRSSEWCRGHRIGSGGLCGRVSLTRAGAIWPLRSEFCGRYRLGDLIKKEGRTFLYRYDFGDGWEHELTLEDSHFVEPVMLCFEGERACPPEDVGGVPGYSEFCRAVKDPAHEDHEELLEWVGGKYDGEDFDRTGINWMLLRYLRWSRDRHLDWGPIEWYEEE